MPEKTGSSLKQRAIAIVVLAVAAWILMKVVIGIVAGLATTFAVILAIVAVVWAMKTL